LVILDKSMTLKTLLKSARDSQHINLWSTELVKAAYRLTGAPSGEWFVKHLPRRGTAVARLPNGLSMRLESEGDDWITNQVYWRGWTADEPEAAPLYFAFAKRSSVVMDIGAHVGLYSIIASLANPAAHIYAFEPLQQTQDRMRVNLVKSSATNVEVIPCAISDLVGTSDLYCAHRGIALSSSLSLGFMTNSVTTPLIPISVPVNTIDEFCRSRQIGGVDLIKLDIEGLEPQALRGMSTLFATSRPPIFCEVLATSGTHAELNLMIRQLGYNIFALTSRGPEEQQELEVAPSRRNYLFTMSSIEELRSLLSAVAAESAGRN
jgi:FkbM family methyltransferase